MKQLFTLFLLFLALNAFAQTADDYWEKWNSNYPEVNVLNVLTSEKAYADSIERNPNIPPYYVRSDKFRFVAEYAGQVRPVDKDVFTSMQNVFKLVVGNPSLLDGLIKSEALFVIGTEKIWMPIQVEILKALKKEMKKGDQAILYCMFLNEHTSKNNLYNTFLISEFK